MKCRPRPSEEDIILKLEILPVHRILHFSFHQWQTSQINISIFAHTETFVIMEKEIFLFKENHLKEISSFSVKPESSDNAPGKEHSYHRTMRT